MSIQSNVSLLPYNTFHIDCIANHFVHITSTADMMELLNTPERMSSERKFFIGGGSNILFTHTTFDGLVVHNAVLGKELREAEDGVYVKVGGGEEWSECIRWTLNQGLCGLENLINIPGSVGAAPIQNIGAYGIEVKEIITEVGGVDLSTKTYRTLSGAECAFGYRDSIFKHTLKDHFFVTDVTFRLQKYRPETYKPNAAYGAIQEMLSKKGVSTPTPTDIANTVAEIRDSKLPNPKHVGTAGSFFKNIYLTEKQYQGFIEKLDHVKPGLEPQVFPIQNAESIIQNYKIPAGWILDQVLGYRGYREGDVGCWPEQALCIVNYGTATGPEIVAFAEKLQKECMEKLGIALEPEVNYIS